MPKPERNLLHAQHNEQALKYMDKKPDFLDWVITMCFYSALHYARYKLFPLEEHTDDGHKFKHKTFDAYCSYHSYHYQKGKHAILQELLEEHHPDIAPEYNQLFDLCKTARYHNYGYDRDQSNLAKSLLEKIKAYCES